MSIRNCVIYIYMMTVESTNLFTNPGFISRLVMVKSLSGAWFSTILPIRPKRENKRKKKKTLSPPVAFYTLIKYGQI